MIFIEISKSVVTPKDAKYSPGENVARKGWSTYHVEAKLLFCYVMTVYPGQPNTNFFV